MDLGFQTPLTKDTIKELNCNNNGYSKNIGYCKIKTTATTDNIVYVDFSNKELREPIYVYKRLRQN